MPRYKLRTLLILLAVGPPIISLAWWYGRVAIGLGALAIIFFPELLIVAFGYAFGALCHLAGGWLHDNRRKHLH